MNMRISAEEFSKGGRKLKGSEGCPSHLEVKKKDTVCDGRAAAELMQRPYNEHRKAHSETSL